MSIAIREVDLGSGKVTDEQQGSEGEALKKIATLRVAREKGSDIVHGIIRKRDR